MVRRLGAIVGSPTVKNGGENVVQPLRHDARRSLSILGHLACVIEHVRIDTVEEVFARLDRATRTANADE